MSDHYLDVNEAAAARLFARDPGGEVVMLNLLRFRADADYSGHPQLAPAQPISGRAAYQRYIDHTLPFLEASGGRLAFLGSGGEYLVGPEGEGWDMVMLVAQRSLADFVAFAANEAYLAGIGHRTAALLDSRILPLFGTHWTADSAAG